MSDDDIFIQQFENCTFPFDQWHHRAHVKLAYLYAVRFGHDIAAGKLRTGIQAYNAANKVQDMPTSGYHETMTMAWLHVIDATIQVYGPRASADEFFDFHPQLGQKKDFAPVLFPGIIYVTRSQARICEARLDQLAKAKKCDCSLTSKPMILEVAILNIGKGTCEDFEAAFREASSIIASVRGYVSHELRRCLEMPNRYILLVKWQTLEAHTIGFRQSSGYQRWRTLLHHFYEPFPTVEHYDLPLVAHVV